jgi:hypothetical protein
MKPSRWALIICCRFSPTPSARTTWSTCARRCSPRQPFAALSLHQHGRAQAHPLYRWRPTEPGMKQPDQPDSLHQRQAALIGCPPVADRGRGIRRNRFSRWRSRAKRTGCSANYLCPADQRHSDFSLRLFAGRAGDQTAARTFTLDRPAWRACCRCRWTAMNSPPSIINSYRVASRACCTIPKSDRRTTQGIFHVTEGGLPIPDDKIGVPKAVFGKLLALALNPPRDLMRLPFTATQPQPAECFVSLLLRPVVCPEVPGFTPEKRWRSVFSRRAISSATWILSKAFLATAATRSCRKTTPARHRTLDRPHRLRHPRAASGQGHQKIRSACRIGTRPPNASAATACAGKTRTNFTTTAAPSSSPAATNAASSSPSSRTIITAIAKRR